MTFLENIKMFLTYPQNIPMLCQIIAVEHSWPLNKTIHYHSSTPDSLSSPQMITNLISAHLFLTTNLKDFIFFPEGLITVCWRYINPLSKQTVFTVFTYLSDLGSSAPRTPGWRSPHCRAGWAGPRTCPSCGRRKDRSLVWRIWSTPPGESPAW